jgi:uncharacterized iron-regulated protein
MARSRAPWPVGLLALLVLPLVSGCASDHATREGGARWASPRERAHPLAGKIWDVREGKFIDEATLAGNAAAAHHVLLGEIHDNLDHHALQARLVRAIAAAGRKPALAFEMLDTSQQAAVDATVARGTRDPDDLAEAVDWAKRGWGPFGRYRPIFAAGLEAGLPIVAANLPRKSVSETIARGLDALAAPVRARIERRGPLSEEARLALREEMKESHCGLLPDAVLEPMVLAQRARDAHLAERLDAAGAGRGTILVAGNEHVRTDRGVPAYLDRGASGVYAIAIVEVQAGAVEPGAYAELFHAQALPVDAVAFTPGAAREDPCEEMRKKHPKPPGDTRAQLVR